MKISGVVIPACETFVLTCSIILQSILEICYIVTEIQAGNEKRKYLSGKRIENEAKQSSHSCMRYSAMTWPRDYKTFFMFNSVEHEILNAHKCKKYQEFQLF